MACWPRTPTTTTCSVAWRFRSSPWASVSRPPSGFSRSLQPLPVPGYVGLGDVEIELHPTEGHTSDGMALVAREAGVLICGDYLSDVEIPMIADAGSAADYRDTLGRLGALVEQAETVIPGHGSPHDRDAARRILGEDLAYLDALDRGEERPRLPRGRDTVRQRQIHADNLAKHRSS